MNINVVLSTEKGRLGTLEIEICDPANVSGLWDKRFLGETIGSCFESGTRKVGARLAGRYLELAVQ